MKFVGDLEVTKLHLHALDWEGLRRKCAWSLPRLCSESVAVAG